MMTESYFVRLVVFAALLLSSQGTCLGQKFDKSKYSQDANDSVIRFQYVNLSATSIYLQEAKVPQADVMSGRIPARQGNGGVSGPRLKFTAEDFLDAKIQLQWWKSKDLINARQPYQGPKDPTKQTYRQDSKFPLFDDQEKFWSFRYVLQPNFQWVGQFRGVVLKPMEAPQEAKQPNKKLVQGKSEADKSTKAPGEWIQFQFRNMTKGEEGQIYFKRVELIQGEMDLELMPPIFRRLPGNEKFQGFTAHNYTGSFFRPVKATKYHPATKLKIVWLKYKTSDGDFEQVLEFPEFDKKKPNWYCYFTLGEDNRWSASFETTD